MTLVSRRPPLQFSRTLSSRLAAAGEAVVAPFRRADAFISLWGVLPCNARLLVMPGSLKDSVQTPAARTVPLGGWGKSSSLAQLRICSPIFQLPSHIF